MNVYNVQHYNVNILLYIVLITKLIFYQLTSPKHKKTDSPLGKVGFHQLVKSKNLTYFDNAVATSTATATVAPTIGLLPIPKKPIIST